MTSYAEIREGLLDLVPEAADALEVAAVTESLGLTDEEARALGYPNVFAFAREFFFLEYSGGIVPVREKTEDPGRPFLRECLRLLQKMSVGLGYSLPWIVLTAVENFYPHALDVPPEFGSALSLAIIASLITTGGFVQVITRDATFFLAAREPFVARRAVLALIRYGLCAVGTFIAIGCLSSIYFHLFSLHDLFLACGHYLLFSTLWMMCATLSAQGLSLLLPVILLGSAGGIAEARTLWHLDAMLALLLWPAFALTLALLISAMETWRAGRHLAQRAGSCSPAQSIHVYSLLPIFLYGTAYFSFLFLDRLCAGSAVPWSSGLTFGVDPVYKHAMDIALLAFLLTAILVEYLSDLFMRRWWQLAYAARTAERRRLSSKLRSRYCGSVCVIAISFAGLLLTAGRMLPSFIHLRVSSSLVEILWLGGAGYMVLSTTLFGSIVLLSLDAANKPSRAAALGLIVNFVVGYTLSHSVAVELAAMGLLTGSIVFAWEVHRSVWQVLAYPDYFYSLV